MIQSLGGQPVPEATYNFETTAFTSPEKFLSIAQILENTGVMAYDGAIAYVETAEVLTAGATIATVEAHHASYLDLITGQIPFPDAFDKPVAPRDVFDAAAKFITTPGISNTDPTIASPSSARCSPIHSFSNTPFSTGSYLKAATQPPSTF